MGYLVRLDHDTTTDMHGLIVALVAASAAAQTCPASLISDKTTTPLRRPPTNNYADTFIHLERFEEAKLLLRKTTPVARRVLGDSHSTTLLMRSNYARALYRATGATLSDLREAVTTLEETVPTARRVLGGAHPLTKGIEGGMRDARAALRARETPSARTG